MTITRRHVAENRIFALVVHFQLSTTLKICNVLLLNKLLSSLLNMILNLYVVFRTLRTLKHKFVALH